jgi:hypothetical protein
LKIEFNRKEEVKHKEECIQKLDDKAVLLNLKKEMIQIQMSYLLLTYLPLQALFYIMEKQIIL